MVKRHGFLGFFAHLFVAVFCAFLCIGGAHAGPHLEQVLEWYTELAEDGLSESPNDATHYFGFDGEQVSCPYDNYCGISSIESSTGAIKDLYEHVGEKAFFKTYKSTTIGEEELKDDLGQMYADVEYGDNIVTDIWNYTFKGIGHLKCPEGTRTIEQWQGETTNGCQCYYGPCTGAAPSLAEKILETWSVTVNYDDNQLELSRNGWLGDNDSSGSYSGVGFNHGIFVKNEEIETYSFDDWKVKLQTLIASGDIGGQHIYLAAAATSTGDSVFTSERFNQIKTCKAESDNGVYGGVGSSCLRLYAFAPNGLPYIYDLGSATNGELVRLDVSRTSKGEGSVYDVEDPDDLAIGCSMYISSDGSEPYPICYYLGYIDGVAVPLSPYSTDHIVDVLTVLYNQNTEQNLAGWTTMADAFDGGWPLTLAFNGDDEGPDSFSGGEEYNGEDESGGGTTTPSYTCEAGTYLPKNSTECVQCPVGYYCTGGTWTGTSGSDRGNTDCGVGIKSEAGSTSASACTPIQYAIHYELDGGTNAAANPAKYTVKSATITLADPTKTGYTFDGWYSESTFKTRVTQIASGSIGVKYLYAKWISNSVTCAAGKYLPANSTTCATCPAGNYCPGGTWEKSSSDQGLNTCPTMATGSTSLADATNGRPNGSSAAQDVTGITSKSGCVVDALFTSNFANWIERRGFSSSSATSYDKLIGKYYFEVRSGYYLSDPTTKCLKDLGDSYMSTGVGYGSVNKCNAGYYCETGGVTYDGKVTCGGTNNPATIGRSQCKTGYTSAAGATSASQCNTAKTWAVSFDGDINSDCFIGIFNLEYGNANYKDLQPIDCDEFFDGTDYYMPLPSSKTGYTFAGWFTGTNGTGIQLTDGTGKILDSVSTTDFGDDGTTFTAYAKWNTNSIACAAGTYLPKNSSTCATCPAGNYCPGGTYASSTSDQGLNACPSFDNISESLVDATNGSVGTGWFAKDVTGITSKSECVVDMPGGANYGMWVERRLFNLSTSAYDRLYAKWAFNAEPGYYLAQPTTKCMSDFNLGMDTGVMYGDLVKCEAGYYCTGVRSHDNSAVTCGGTNNPQIIGRTQCKTGYTSAAGATACTPITYKVTLDKQDGTGGTSEYYYAYETKGKCYYYTTSALSTCTDSSDGQNITKPTRTGYTFGGYYTGKNGTGTQYVNANGLAVNNLYKTTGDRTLYANWEPKQWSLGFDTSPDACDEFLGIWILEYGTDAPDTLQPSVCENLYDSEGFYHMPIASQTGYTFAGWYTGENGTGIQLTDATGKILDSVYTTDFGGDGNLTAYPKWTANKYAVYFGTNGGTGGQSMGTATYGELMAKTTPLPTRAGYTFQGYTDAQTGGTLYYNADGTAARKWDKASNTTLYAQWEPVVYTVNLDPGSGATGGTRVIYERYAGGWYSDAAATQSISKITLPVKNGYTFGGYYSSNALYGGQQQSESAVVYSNNAMATPILSWSSTTAYATAKWTANTYKITYDADGGTMPSGTYRTTYTVADAEFALPIPTKAGYTFFGWSDADSKDIIESTQKFVPSDWASDVTFTAKWTPIVYTVNFDAGSGSTPTHTTIYEMYNTGWYSDAATNNQIKKITAPTKDGYTFGGFFTDYTYGSAVVAPDGTLASPLFTGSNGSTSMTFTAAKWTAKNYYILFDSNNGYGGASSATGTYDAKMDTLTSLPTRPGYTFAGYFDAKTGGTKYYNADGTAARTWNKAADTTLYAQWTIETYTITYNLNGGTNPAGAPSSYTVETATFDLPTPTRTSTSDADYGFVGWYENSGLTGDKVTQITRGTTGNKTYWASWTEIKRPVSKSVTCDAGTYIAAGATTCTTCTAGYACAGGSYTIPKDGATSDIGRVQCTGTTYAAAGAAQCTSCPSPYTHDTSAGKIRAEQCTVQTSAPGDSTGWYIKDAKGDKVYCPEGYYCPSAIVAYGSTNSPIACPATASHTPTTWPTSYRSPTVENSSIFASGSHAAATGCMAQYLLKNDAGTIFVLNNYNDKTQKYDTEAGSGMGYDGYYMWYVSLNPGYYFTKKWQQTIDGETMDWCQASASSDGDIPQLYQEAAPCPAGSYCPGHETALDMFAENITIPDGWPKCSDGEYTNTNGINACPTAYANSVEKSSAIEQCWLTTTAGKYVASAKADQVQCLKNNYCAGGTKVHYGSTGGMQPCATGYESAAGASKCNAITYTITYNLDGGAAPKANPTSYTVETPTITLADSYKTGYTFGGWYSDAAFKTRVTQIAQGSTGNKTLWAKWTIDTYHINYVLNNGTNDPRNPTTFTGADTTLHIYPASRTGYTMDGWGSEFIGELLAPDVDIENPYSDFDLQAQWTANTYTITLDVNGGTGGQASVTATYDAVLPTLTKLPTKINWVFMGYFDAATGGVQYYDASGHPTSTAKWNKTNGMTLYAQYAQDIVSCLRGQYYNGTSMVQCPAGMYCPGTGSVDAGVAGCGTKCPTSHANSAAGAASANECFTSCTEYSLVGGTAVPASPRVNYPANCTFNGVSDTGNPCDIVDGRCVERSCKSDYELIGDRCTPCDREHALSYKTTGNCVVASCEPGFHPDSRQCVENTMECYAPNAVSAVREWDSRTNSFTICRITECESGFHIMSNACISDIQPCTLENGNGTKEWNHTTGAYGECVASECAPGYTNDPYDSHNPGAQCGECKNKYDAAGNQVASTYVRGCEIASCMYQGEKYALDGGECVSICDEHSDETGSMKWNGKKCIRTCNDGYMPW